MWIKVFSVPKKVFSVATLAAAFKRHRAREYIHNKKVTKSSHLLITIGAKDNRLRA